MISLYARILFLLLPCLSFGQVRPAARDLAATLAYCDSIVHHVYESGNGVYFTEDHMWTVALQGLKAVPAGDVTDSAALYYYTALGYGHEHDITLDSLLRFYYTGLRLAQQAHAAALTAKVCESLIHIEFELQEPEKVDSCERILASIIDTSTDKSLLPEGYSTLGNYYKSKAYYSTAQEYIYKSIGLRRARLDQGGSAQQRLDYAGQCYTLAQLYLNTGLPGKALGMLYEGWKYRGMSGLTELRYTCSFIQSFCKLGRLDSALYYLHHTMDTLETHFKTGKIVAAEIIYSNVAVAQSYIDSGRYAEALPYLDKLDSITTRMNEGFVIYEANRMKAKYFIGVGKDAQAVPLLAKALPVAARLSRENYTDILKDMATAQKRVGNREAALQYYDRYVGALDSVTNEKISRTFADEQTRYETDRKEERIVSLDKDNHVKALELQNGLNVRRLLILGLVALGIIAFLLFLFYRRLSAANDQLGEANETKARLFGIISHDLRSPVSRIVQLLQVQKERPDWLDDATRRRHEEKVREAGEQVLETMEDLLLWSKSQMKQFVPQAADVAIAPLLEKEVALQREVIGQKGGMVRLDVPAALRKHTDENFLSVVVRNLLQNAIRYGDEGSAILIVADHRMIRISNDSANADVESLNRRLADQQVNSKGSGLGLQIAGQLAGAIGARLRFEREGARVSAIMAWK